MNEQNKTADRSNATIDGSVSNGVGSVRQLHCSRRAGLCRVGTFPEKKESSKKNAPIYSSGQRKSRATKRRVSPKGFNPGNGQVIDPATTFCGVAYVPVDPPILKTAGISR